MSNIMHSEVHTETTVQMSRRLKLLMSEVHVMP